MGPQHQRSLEHILKKTQAEFEHWVAGLSDKEIAYVEWLLEKADEALDELIFEEYGLTEAAQVITRIMEK
jgi:hypothetical protein